MTVSTTLKLSGQLKDRIASAAAASGKTAHAWMIDAIEAQTSLAERRQSFVASALTAEQEVAQYGLVYDADEVFSYIKAKAEGKTNKRPSAHKL